MAVQDIAAALERVESVLARRPEAGLHDDAPGTARWEGGTRVVATHANGMQVLTDMPQEFGGSGDQVSPGWLVRAGFASCTATCIALAAARQGVELTALEVRASSRSDVRGLMGVADEQGQAVYSGPRDMRLVVQVSARGVSQERLRALIEDAYRRSPMGATIQDAVPVALHIEIASG